MKRGNKREKSKIKRINNRLLYSLISLLLVTLIVGGVYAVYPASGAGHNSNEIDFTGGFNVPSGNVGIGTTSPSAKLDVRGDYSAVLGSDGMLKIKSVSGGSCPECGTEALTLQTSIDSRSDDYDINNYGGQSRHVLSLQPQGGYVGIGTTTPGAKLEVAGKVIIDANDGTSNNYNEGIRINVASNNYSVIHLGGATGSWNGTGSGQWDVARSPDGTFAISDSSGVRLSISNGTGDVITYADTSLGCAPGWVKSTGRSCIMQNKANAGNGLSWYSAADYCYTNYNARLCSADEFFNTCNHGAISNCNTGAWEWLQDYGESGQFMAVIKCCWQVASRTPSDAISFRCCK